MSLISRHRLSPLLACAFIILGGGTFATSASAQIVYNNGVADNINGWASDPNVTTISTETFTFASLSSFNTIIWYGTYVNIRNPRNSTAPAFPDVFTISLYNTTAGTPDLNPSQTFNVGNAATRTLTGGSIQGLLSVYQYTFTLPSTVTLPSGVYGLGIINDTVADTNNDWFWATSSQSGSHFEQFAQGNEYGTQNNELAFRLVNVAATSPEPGSLALLALGALSGVATVVRRRAKIG